MTTPNPEREEFEKWATSQGLKGQLDVMTWEWKAWQARAQASAEDAIPREPTDAMLDALTDRTWKHHTAWTVWRAMYDAAMRESARKDSHD